MTTRTLTGVIGQIPQPHVCSPDWTLNPGASRYRHVRHAIGTVWACPTCGGVWVAERHHPSTGWASDVPRWRRETRRERRRRYRNGHNRTANERDPL